MTAQDDSATVGIPHPITILVLDDTGTENSILQRALKTIHTVLFR